VVRGKARLVRRKTVVYDGSIMSLRHFQDEVSEMRAGMECGIRLQGFNEFQPGDVIESYTVEKAAAQLE
jgi:translation initiation factor IF-2